MIRVVRLGALSTRSTHHEVVTGLAPLKLHLLREKPLATTLGDCADIYRQLRLNQGPPCVLFSVGQRTWWYQTSKICSMRGGLEAA